MKPAAETPGYFVLKDVAGREVSERVPSRMLVQMEPRYSMSGRIEPTFQITFDPVTLHATDLIAGRFWTVRATFCLNDGTIMHQFASATMRNGDTFTIADNWAQHERGVQPIPPYRSSERPPAKDPRRRRLGWWLGFR